MPSETTATSPRPDSPRRRHRPDWYYAAELIADGVAPDAVAALIGTQPKYVQRQLRQSRRLARWIALFRGLRGPLPAAGTGDAGQGASLDRATRDPTSAVGISTGHVVGASP